MAERRGNEPELWRIFQRRGTPQILLALSHESPLRSSELDRRIPGIARQILSERLKELGDTGMVLREVDPGPPVAVSYSLSDEGERLAVAAIALHEISPGMVLESSEDSLDKASLTKAPKFD